MNLSAVSRGVSLPQTHSGMHRAAPESSSTEEAHESQGEKAREQQLASAQRVSSSAPSSNGAGRILNRVA
jgi:hypothetical protein